MDPATGRVEGRSYTFRFDVNQLAVGEDGTVWVTHTAADAVSRIDPADETSSTIEDVANDPTGIAVGSGSAWVASSLERALVRIDAESGGVQERIPLGSVPESVVVAEDRVWVTTVSGG